jgi:hypothetical protein
MDERRLREVDSSGAGVYGRPTSPPLEGVLLRAQGRGLREEGGTTERAASVEQKAE